MSDSITLSPIAVVGAVYTRNGSTKLHLSYSETLHAQRALLDRADDPALDTDGLVAMFSCITKVGGDPTAFGPFAVLDYTEALVDEQWDMARRSTFDVRGFLSGGEVARRRDELGVR